MSFPRKRESIPSIIFNNNSATTSNTSEEGCSNSATYCLLDDCSPSKVIFHLDPREFQAPPNEISLVTGGFSGAVINPDPVIPPYIPLPVTQSNTQGHSTSYEYYKDGSIKKATNYLGRSTNYYNVMIHLEG